MKSLDQKMTELPGFTSGFDYMRLFLAILVMFGHSFIISGNNVAHLVMPYGLSSIRVYVILPVFFCLSGFLIAASLIRTPSLKIFMALRGLRILPALAMEIFLSALLLGPLLTTKPLIDYFFHTEFYQYFFNIFGYIHYNLPGLFIDNPVPRTVNGSLWTVPYEAECYILLAVLVLMGLIKRPKLFATLLAICSVIACIIAFLQSGEAIDFRATANGRQLVLFFLSGVLLFFFRAQVPHSFGLFIACVIAVIAMIRSHEMIYLTLFPVAYVTAYLGLLRPKKIPVIFAGDYSYGIYLYAYPIQQSVQYLLPHANSWYANFLISLVLTAPFAAFSWHFVEKPALKLKNLLLEKSKNSPPLDAAVPAPSEDLTIKMQKV